MWFTSLLFTLMAAVVALGPVNHLGLPRWLEIVLGLGLVGLAQHYLLHRVFGASIIAPDAIPLPILLIFLWGASFLMAAAGWTILCWVAMLCRVPVPQWVPLALGVVSASILLWLGLRQPPVREHTLRIDGLPTEAEGLRIAVVADLHIDHVRGRAWCETFVRRLNAQKPDIIVFTGDQVDGGLEERREDLAPLRDLVAPHGKFLISGNHEYYREPEAILAYYAELGLTVLDRKTAVARGLGFIGVPDGRSLTQSVNGELVAELRDELPADVVPILLVHKPGIAPLADKLGIKVQFSGHTHGGQLPLVYSTMGRFNGGFVRGWYDLPRGMQLFVAPGSGVWIGFPYRLYPSEMSIIRLVRGDSEA